MVATLKGKEIKDIVLCQDGSSKDTYKGYPLFTHGNEMVLFLKESSYAGYDNAYWIIGSYTTIYDVVKVSGESYLIDRSWVMSESVVGLKNYADDEKLCCSHRQKLVKDDDIWSDVEHPKGMFFPLPSLKTYCQAIVKISSWPYMPSRKDGISTVP